MKIHEWSPADPPRPLRRGEYHPPAYRAPDHPTEIPPRTMPAPVRRARRPGAPDLPLSPAFHKNGPLELPRISSSPFFLFDSFSTACRPLSLRGGAAPPCGNPFPRPSPPGIPLGLAHNVCRYGSPRQVRKMDKTAKSRGAGTPVGPARGPGGRGGAETAPTSQIQRFTQMISDAAPREGTIPLDYPGKYGNINT